MTRIAAARSGRSAARLRHGAARRRRPLDRLAGAAARRRSSSTAARAARSRRSPVVTAVFTQARRPRSPSAPRSPRRFRGAPRAPASRALVRAGAGTSPRARAARLRAARSLRLGFGERRALAAPRCRRSCSSAAQVVVDLAPGARRAAASRSLRFSRAAAIDRRRHAEPRGNLERQAAARASRRSAGRSARTSPGRSRTPRWSRPRSSRRTS